ncbi:hypothetical protein [Parerythrobacter jejuensis]|uniref:Uncharacterized protein n=1 Tax=Parerythrobacter jejuensis TaxID=795812 RepID=A0A845ARC0_9SPHN|nr:hypothetical protein [Parerythrobacter jejuensis]MXP31743.1 hypothetical protein [Parerythrobacter jejuensis]
MEISPKLQHLTNEEIENLVREYYKSGLSNVELIERYNISVNPSRLVSLFPPLVHDDLLCPYCSDEPMISRRPSKSSHHDPSPECPSCGHKQVRNCYCQNCRDKQEWERKRFDEIKREIIREDYGRDYARRDLSELTLRDAVYVSALARYATSEDLKFATPYEMHSPPLAPTHGHVRSIVRHLYREDLIGVDTESSIEAFVFDDELTRAPEYYPAKVDWHFLPAIEEDHKRAFLNELAELIDAKWKQEWLDDIAGLWREIVKEEALEYYFHLLEQRDYQIDAIGEKTHTVFDFLIERFPLSKIYNLTWQAVRDVTDYNVKEGIPRYRGKNNFVGAIQRKAERFIAQGWDLRDSRRDFNCPQSVISAVFFNTFLRRGDEGFTSLPPQE